MSTHLFTENLARERMRDLRDSANRVHKARRARFSRSSTPKVKQLWRWEPATATYEPADAA